MNPSDDHEPGRNTALVVSLVLAIAFIAASWDRLSVPFSASEARFVHQALRESGQATSPDFDRPANPVPARILTVVQQLVGYSERALRLAMLVLGFAAMAFLSEIVPGRGRVRFALPLLVLLSGIAFQLGVLHCGVLVILPAALALLAAPIGPPVTNVRALLGLAGSLALGAIGFEAALVSGAILAVVSLVRGTLLERLTGLVTAAAGLAMSWVVHGAPSFSFPFPSLALLRWSSDWTMWPTLVFGALVLVSLFVNDGFRRHRAALAIACVAALSIALGFLGTLQDLTGLYLAVMTTTPAFYLLMAATIAAFPPATRGLGVVVFVGAIVIGLMRPPIVPETTALDVLAQARMAAQPGAALAVSGDDRVAIAVYARFGRAPMMPIAYVPEDVTVEGLPKWCRDRGIRQLWVSPLVDEAPPGFSAPASRPAATPLIMPLVVEGS